MKTISLLFTLSFFPLASCGNEHQNKVEPPSHLEAAQVDIVARCPIYCGNHGYYPPEIESVIMSNQGDPQDSRESVTMDLLNLDREMFNVLENVDYGRISMEIAPRKQYRIMRVTYGSEVLCIAPGGWDCTHAEFYSDGIDVLIVLEYKRDSMRDYRAIYKQGDSWRRVDILRADEIIFYMAKDPNPSRSEIRRSRGIN